MSSSIWDRESERDSYFSLTSPIKLPSLTLPAPEHERDAKSPGGASGAVSPVTGVGIGVGVGMGVGDGDETVVAALTEQNLRRLNYETSNVHPFVHTYTSPIGACRVLFHCWLFAYVDACADCWWWSGCL